MQTQNVHWRVSLSSGETFTEGVGIFAEVEAGNSPWQKLLALVETDGTQITSLVLVTDDNRTFNLPAAGKNPKFRRFALAGKPDSYRCERALGTDRNVHGKIINEQDWFTIAVAVYNNYELQLWVSENDTRNCWVLVVPKI
jgi:hypothetical protein